MSPLVWLAIPVAGLVVGILWAVWTSRTRPRADTHETLEEHARFKAVFDREPPDSRPPGTRQPPTR